MLLPLKPVILLASLAAPLFAQSLEGTWQGTLTSAPNREIRMVFKITKAANAYRGLYYNLDAARQLNLGAITMQGSAIKIIIPGIAAIYEGKIEADGKSIIGELTEGGRALPLALKRATAETAWELPPPPADPKPLPEGTKLEFEVASIRPSQVNRRPLPGFNVSATELRSPNASIAGLITFAFELHIKQVVGLPGWAETEGYAIAARLPQGGEPTDSQIRTMLKNLLQTRCGLVFHMEQREVPVYAIRMGKNGPAGIKMASNTTSGPNIGSQGLGRVRFRGMTMGGLATQLQLRVLDRPVIDQTGLEGRYDFTLDWRPDEFHFPFATEAQRAAALANGDALPDLFTAFQEQLGLKLEAAKATLTVLVIDKLSKPSEN